MIKRRIFFLGLSLFTLLAVSACTAPQKEVEPQEEFTTLHGWPESN